MNTYGITLNTRNGAFPEREVIIKAYSNFHAGTKAKSIHGNMVVSIRLIERKEKDD
jgi:hypothetical protein|tara:strand:- start:390 stop:557 length:168 start_codon:yes stop_codon:yes gene_type:complete